MDGNLENRKLGREIARLLGGRFLLSRCAARAWASASFSGQRHEFWFRGELPELPGILKLETQIAECEFCLDGAIVADARISVSEDSGQLYFEALTVQS